VADAYLNVAERVLLQARRPLRPREIIDAAYASDLVPWHLHGPTQDKTLHARISEDVAGGHSSSRFFRTGPGVFFLRTLLEDPRIPALFKQPYYAPPRRKELRRERVLALTGLRAAASGPRGDFVAVAQIQREFERGRYKFVTPAEMALLPVSVPVHSFVLVYHEDRVLSYVCGKFFPDDAPLKGKRSIGIGGSVYAGDRDMLFDDMFGVVASGINELGYGIGLTKELSERARYGNEVTPCAGVLVRLADGRAVLHVVLAYECPLDFLPSKAALSVNDLRWLDMRNPANTLEGFDRTSALLFSSGRVAAFRGMLRERLRG
jgi:hypothetical protein